MKRIHNITYLLASLLVAYFLVGCVDDTFNDIDMSQKEYVAFRAALTAQTRATTVGRGSAEYLEIDEVNWDVKASSNSAVTRAELETSLNGMNVGVYGFVNGTEVENLANHRYHFINEEIMEPADEPVAWKELGDTDDKLKIYSYAPFQASATAGYNVSVVDNVPFIVYTPDADVKKQIDIISSDVKEVPCGYRQNIPLAFHHITTGIRFKVAFPCTVKSLQIVGVYGKGSYSMDGIWSVDKTGTAENPAIKTFTVFSGANKSVAAGDYITADDEILMMVPQMLPDDAKVVLTYDDDQVIEASLKGMRWDKGKLVTYNIYDQKETTEYIYFDLNAGNVDIQDTYYKGAIYVNGVVKKFQVNTSPNNKKFYVYQSNPNATAGEPGCCTETGWTDWDEENNKGIGVCRVPNYPTVMVGSQYWSDFITNNTSVEDVIETWDDGKYVRPNGDNAKTEKLVGTAVVRDAGRSHTKNYISVSGTGVKCELTIDNIYSTFHDKTSEADLKNGLRNRDKGGITYLPLNNGGSILTINLIGDSRLGAVHIDSGKNANKSDQIIFQGTGSLTVANADFLMPADYNYWDSSYYGTTKSEQGYISNHRKSAIGNDTQGDGQVYGLYFKSGTIFAGTTKIENCSAIGGGGNGHGQLFIEGGTVTAVATTTGTAIGGGIGFKAVGGTADVTISGGNVYAYNFANRWGVPSTSIGGGGSKENKGVKGTINISNGYVYAYSEEGAAIGGGSSASVQGGEANVTISGGYVIAKSGSGTSIGGGNAGTEKNGGNATVNISGGTIRTGSIGGGKKHKNNTTGNIGYANITVTGGDISGQFVMAAGTKTKSTFTMTGGLISNSDVESKEFYHIVKEGGAVYMEDGSFTMTDGVISNCSSDCGGAVYIKKTGSGSPEFIMSGGTIEDCQSTTHGGAVYLGGGNVELTGGSILNNLAQKGNGGGIYAAGNLTINGNVTIAENSALQRDAANCGNGGGIYVTSPGGDVAVNVLSGYIYDNTSTYNGGGICVDMKGNPNEANVVIGEIGSAYPEITANKGVLYGGGLYAIGEDAHVVINGGKIKGNSVSNYVPNQNVTNELGSVVLNGGDVDYIVVTFDINSPEGFTAQFPGGSTESAHQNIVTASNTSLVVPAAPTCTNYNFKGWNTRADGNGVMYENGRIVNVDESFVLYAKWESQ